MFVSIYWKSFSSFSYIPTYIEALVSTSVSDLNGKITVNTRAHIKIESYWRTNYSNNKNVCVGGHICICICQFANTPKYSTYVVYL